MSVRVAFKAFFAALFQPAVSEKIQKALAVSTDESKDAAQPEKVSPPKDVEISRASKRSDALTLLSTLQREGRFLDLVHESLDEYDDAQVGGAAREVIADCRKTLERMFAIVPVSDLQEGASTSVPEKASPIEIRLVGGGGRIGTVTHRGWKATMCEVPKWGGRQSESWILAPTEIDVGTSATESEK